MKNTAFVLIICLISAASGWVGHRFFSTTISAGHASITSETTTGRLPVSVDQSVVADSKRLDEKILSINSKEKLKSVLNEIIKEDKDQNYDNEQGGKWDISSPTLRLYGIAAKAFLLLEGSAYRMRDIVEPIIPAYVSAITSIRGARYYLSHYPKHISVGFDFLVDPNPKNSILGHKGKFKSITQLQDYLLDKISPEMNKLISETKLISERFKNTPIWVTNLESILGKTRAAEIYASSSQRGGEEHFQKILLGGHLDGAIAIAYQTLATGTYALAFQIDGAHQFINSLTKQSYSAGLSRTSRVASIFVKNKIPSPREISQTLTKVNTKFLTIRDGRSNLLSKAQKLYRMAIDYDLRHHRNLIKQASSLDNPTSYIINPKEIIPREHHIMMTLTKRSELLNSEGPVDFEIPATREKMRVNISAAFDPASFGKPKSFYPVCFYGDRTSSICPKTRYGHKLHGQESADQKIDTRQFIGRVGADFQWNYLYGRPEYWPDPTFGGLFINGTQGNVVENISKFASAPYLPTLGAFLSHFK